MKSLVLSLVVLLSSTAFADAPAQAVKSTLTKGLQILTLKSSDARNKQMCALMKGALDSQHIGAGLLGSYMQSSDQNGVKLFIKQLPSMMTSELIAKVGSANGAQVDVGNNSFDRGGGVFEVAITIHASNGNAYNGKAIVAGTKTFRLIDVEYMGMSAVQYLGNSIQQKIGAEASSTPVTAYVKEQMAQPDFIQCK